MLLVPSKLKRSVSFGQKSMVILKVSADQRIVDKIIIGGEGRGPFGSE